jgi:hypothetical protein
VGAGCAAKLVTCLAPPGNSVHYLLHDMPDNVNGSSDSIVSW